jgi:hypothetical protein
MRSTTEKRERPRRKAFGSQQDLVIHLGRQTGSGLCAKLLDCSATGISLELEWPVEEGATVNVAGEIDSATGRQKLNGPCKVRWCTEIAPGKFVAGLAFAVPNKPGTGKPEADAEEAPVIDYYETLQLSRSAETETIRRVFHVMASRYHPDNKETGNAEMFRQMVEAHEVLSDPEKRAALDARLAAQAKGRVHLFKTFEESQGVEAEIRKRQGILRLLYTKRLTEAHAPSLSSRDFEEVLAIPREHLEFSFWLLKESRLITRADNNRFEITVQGVLAYEAEERSRNKAAPAPLPIVADLLPAPQ